MSEDLYLEHILDHYRHPRNKVALTGEHNVCSVANHGCGDKLSVLVKLGKSNTIESIVWDGTGCAISQASASILSDLLVGLSPADLAAWDKDKVEQVLGIELSPAREKCALLFVRAVSRGLSFLENGIHS